jgi:hypothetical protein
MWDDEVKITLAVEVTVRRRDVDDIKHYLRGEHNGHKTLTLLAGNSSYMVSGIHATCINQGG